MRDTLAATRVSVFLADDLALSSRDRRQDSQAISSFDEVPVQDFLSKLVAKISPVGRQFTKTSFHCQLMTQIFLKTAASQYQPNW
jgi:adenylylsulfate kinase-like enzyme